MNLAPFYILIAIITLLAIMVVLILTGRKRNRPLTPLTGLALAFIVSGIVFSDNTTHNIVGYSLMGVGVVLAIVDVVIKMKHKKK